MQGIKETPNKSCFLCVTDFSKSQGSLIGQFEATPVYRTDFSAHLARFRGSLAHQDAPWAQTTNNRRRANT